MAETVRATVLLVGDNVDDAAARLERMAQSLDVRTASTASDARLQLSDDAIDAIICESELSDSTGVDLLTNARQREATLPFIICSADGDLDAALAASEQDVSGYLPAALDDIPPADLESLAVDLVTTNRAKHDSERDSARLKALLANTSDAIVTVDTDGVIRDANAGLETVLGYPPEAVKGRPLTGLIPPDLVDAHLEAFERYLRTGEQQLDWQDIHLTAEHADGHRVPVSVSFAEFTIDTGHYFTGIIRDITTRVESKARLEQQNERLDEFTSVVSHDLRNPINIARGNVQLVQDDVDNDRLATALDALATMDDIVTALLALARLGDIAEDTDAISLGELAREVWGTLQPGTATLTIEADAPTVVGDRRAIRQLIMNLLLNAVDHGGPDVTVTLGSLPTGFFVADDGDGIPPGRRTDVLQPGHTTNDTGTGFGLSIVARVADAHNWEITVTESAHGGARFEFTGVDTGDPGTNRTH